MDHQQNIRRNRQKIRNGLKQLLNLDKPKMIEASELKLFKEKQSTGSKMRRKTSADIRKLGNCWDMAELNQMIVDDCFEQFFELREKIDEGAHSVVYMCEQKQSGKQFAVKSIRMKDFDIIYTLKQQFRILKSLDHPNIIKADRLYINQKLGVSHLVSQYFKMPNLRVHMNRNRLLTEMEAADILNPLLHALKYIHTLGICHRDVKPENILYDLKKGELKLIDFEISKMVKYEHQRLEMWSNIGTEQYKAPQMLSGTSYSQLIDIWAVGIIAYELVIGTPPFQHLYTSQLYRKIRQQQPNYDKPHLTKSCIQFIQKCLHKNPLYRFTAHEALHSSFLLKYSSLSSSTSSPKFKKNGSEGCKKEAFEIECQRCFDEDSSLVNKAVFEGDTGIRVVLNSEKK